MICCDLIEDISNYDMISKWLAIIKRSYGVSFSSAIQEHIYLLNAYNIP